VPTIFANAIAPGRITFADIRYSRARFERQRRGVVLHRPVGQELLQFLHLLTAGRGLFPAQVLGDLAHVVGPGPGPLSISPQRPGCRPSALANRATATGGAALTSSGTNPSQRRDHHGHPQPVRRAPAPPRSTNASRPASA
jgi:hypothetical protein